MIADGPGAQGIVSNIYAGVLWIGSLVVTAIMTSLFVLLARLLDPEAGSPQISKASSVR